MSLLINLRHLSETSLFLKGELPVAELDLDALDKLIHVQQPLSYDLEVQELEQAVLAQGTLVLPLECECVRCLKSFRHRLELKDWACHLPLDGEDKVEVINDCVDLTPYLREDIVLAFPQHPLCKPDCRGLAGSLKKAGEKPDATGAWAALDQLKLKK